MFFVKFLHNIKDYLFPINCLGCNIEGKWVCEKCFKNIPVAGIFCCPVCHSGNGSGAVCHDCARHSALDKAVAVYKYEENRLPGKVIEYFKYNFIEELLQVIDNLIRIWFSKRKDIFADAVIVPVPLHAKRLAGRGFNQAQKIAQILQNITQNKIEDLLVRKVYTKQQAKLNKSDRRANVLDAFVWIGETAPSKVILVDDVFTTGATMQECARVLKENGVKEVSGFTLARG